MILFNTPALIVMCVLLLVITWLVYRRKQRVYRFLFVALIIVYGLCVAKFTLFPLINGSFYPDLSFTYGQIINIQFIPLKTIDTMLSSYNWPIQVLGNVVLFMPIPFFAGFMQRELKVLKLIAVGLICSVSIEVMQLVLNLITQYPNRAVDIDDIILNGFGVLIGALLFSILHLKMDRAYTLIDKRIVRKQSKAEIRKV